MAEQRITRKRASEAQSEDHTPVTKRRVVLGQLPNSSNVITVKPGDGVQQLKPMAAKDDSSRVTAAVKGKGYLNVDIDAGSDDPQMSRAYVSDIYEYLRNMELEPKRRPLPDYIEKVQYDLNPNMRGILVDWLVEVADEYKLVSDTLYLAISYVDRYLSSNQLTRQKLQLLGVAAMLISSKYEEISPPHLEDFCYITDNSYTREEIVKMEASVLKSLNFEMGNPTIKTFLRRFDRFAQEGYETTNLELEFLGCYLAELSLLDYSCIKFLPSLVAASVIFLARYILQIPPWISSLQKYSGYSPKDLQGCVKIIHNLYLGRKANGLQAVREKYKQQKFKSVATLACSLEIPDVFFEDVKD